MVSASHAPSPGRRQRITRVAIAVALLLSSSAAFMLWGVAGRYYRELQATRLHPLGLEFLEVPGAPDVQRPLIAYVGDSRVEDWQPRGRPDGASVINLGLDTQTTAQVRLRWEHHVTPLAPDVVVLQVGINDLKTVALFSELRGRIIDDCVGNIAAMVAEAERAGSRVVLTTVVPPGPIPLWRRPVWSPDVRRAVDEVNVRLALLTRPGVELVDLTDVLCDADGQLLDEVSRDALHLTQEAYALIDRALQPALQRALERLSVANGG